MLNFKDYGNFEGKLLLKSMIYGFCVIITIWACSTHQTKNSSVNGDDYYEKCRKLVLRENKVSKHFNFKIPGKSIDEFEITFLGIIKTSKGDTLKFINFANYFGQFEESKRSGGGLYIYDSQNNKKGVYNVGGSTYLPSKLNGANLIFSYNNESCNQTTVIRFLDSIPNSIFINCTKEGGDLYNFNKE